MKRVLCLVLAILCSTSLLATATDVDLPGPAAWQTDSAKRHLAEAAAERASLARATALGKSWAPEATPSPIDVLSYDLDLALDMDRQQLSGTATLEVAAVDDGLGVIELDMDLGLRTVAVTLLGDPALPHDGPRGLAWQHADDRLAVTLPRPLASGETVRLQITYGGAASRYGYGMVWQYVNGRPLAWTFAEPFGARIWFPCNDRPDDKALVTIHATAPDFATVSSNGREIGRVDNGDGTATTTWASQYPIATYLVVLNAGDYDVQELTYTGLDGTTMPVQTYVFPFAADQAAVDLASTPDMIATLAGSYGEYPFLAEKYGNCTTYFGGGMEHQTLTTYAVSAIGTSFAPWLNVHELAHQWWGDWVTCPDWRELWLNEGFATHSEWLWAEHLGDDVLQQYLLDTDANGYFIGALYDNPVSFSSTVYDKGAWVLRMLRHTVGDEHFFAALAAYRAAHGGAGGTSEQLRAAFEAETGEDLEWFFDQWVYGANRPHLQYSWEAVAGPGLQLHVDQEQSDAAPFRLPMEVEITTTAGVERHRVDLPAARSADLTVTPLAGTPTEVRFDPDNWILAEISPADEPALDLGPDYPGPYDVGLLRAGQETALTIPFTNTGGSVLEVTDLEANQGTSWQVVSPAAPFGIAPGETVDVELRFRSAGRGVQSDYLVALCNARAHGGLVVAPLTGRSVLAAGPRVATQTSLNLGTAPVGAFSERSLPLENLGDEPLTIATALSGDGFGFGGPVPTVLGPGESAELFLRFQPSAAGDHEGSLTLTTNDPVRSQLDVRLRGQGVAAPRAVVSPATLHLGLGPAPAPATATVHNMGDAELTVAAVTIDGPFSFTDSPDLPASLPPGGELPITVAVAGGQPGELRGELRILTDDPSLAWSVVPLSALVTAAEPVQVAVPAAASSDGLGGARWTTTATLLNPGPADLAVDLAFRPDASHTGPAGVLQLTVPAGGQRRIEDVVGALGETGAGGLGLTVDGPGLVASTRTFSSEAGGTFGQHIGGVAADQTLAAGDTAVLAGLAGNGGFHTNLGVLNLGDLPLTVRFQLFVADGTALGERQLTVAARGYAQQVSVLATLTGAVVRGGYALVSSDDAGAAFTAWASVVDDVSHDPTFIAPLATPSTALVVPAAASTNGLGGTVWRTDLSLVNIGETEVDVTLGFAPEGGFSGIIPGTHVTVAAGRAVLLSDVVGDLLNWHTAGWLRINADSVGIRATSRTYTVGEAGTFGQLVPAMPAASAAMAGDTVVIPGLREDASFRCNLGIASLATQATTVTARFFSDAGELIGELPIELPAGAFVQEVRVLAERFGYSGSAWVELSSDDPGAAFLAHASVVDGTSGDPAYIPAAPVAR